MAGAGGGFGAGTMAGPPPLSQPGGASISDAFEGLDGVGGGMGDVLKNPPTSGFHYGAAGGDTRGDGRIDQRGTGYGRSVHRRRTRDAHDSSHARVLQHDL